MQLKYLIGADDALDIFALHAVGGFIGELLTGIFAANYIAHLDGVTTIKGGWLNHNWVQLGIQLADAVASLVWSFVLTYLILIFMRLLGKFVPAFKLRMDEDQEEQGVDDIEIGEFAYDYVERIREVKVTDDESLSQHSRSIDNSAHPDLPQPGKEASSYPIEISRPASTYDQDRASIRTG